MVKVDLAKTNLSGSVIGTYQLRSLLGAGGMGQVYLAYHEHLDRFVALKVLQKDLSSDIHLDRFHREARAACKVRHPNVITIYDYGDHHGMPYLVCLLYTSPSPRDQRGSRMPSSA